MGRSDAILLGVPGAKNAESQLNAALHSLKAELSRPVPREADPVVAPASASQPKAAAAEITLPARVKHDDCPHCQAKLSALDLKFDRCLGCGKQLAAPLGVSTATTQESFTVRI